MTILQYSITVADGERLRTIYPPALEDQERKLVELVLQRAYARRLQLEATACAGDPAPESAPLSAPEAPPAQVPPVPLPAYPEPERAPGRLESAVLMPSLPASPPPPAPDPVAAEARERALSPTLTQGEIARAKGFTGDTCRDCGGFSMVRNGTCLKCNDCGGTTGCS